MKWKAIRTFLGIFTAVFIVGYLTVSAMGTAESGVVTVVEYGYDSGSKEVNDFWNCATVSGVTCAYDSSVDAGGSAGSGSLHITTQKDSSIWGNQVFTLDGSGGRVTFDKDTDYVVSMDVKSSADGEISLLGANPNFVVDNSSKKVSASDGWIRYEVRVCFDSSNTTYFIVGSGAEYWFDNIKIKKYPSKPKLDSSEPENGEVITPSSTITLCFNNEMNDDSVLNSANYLLNGKKSVSEVVKKDEKSYVLRLDQVMIPDTDYVLRVEGLVDIYGQAMENFSISFRTERGVEPHIQSTVPSNGAYNVQLDDIMTVVFDSEIDLATATVDQISISGNARIDSIMIDASNPKQIRIKFNGLDYLTEYLVRFSGIKGASGEDMPDTVISFTTQPMETIIYQNNISAASDVAWPVIYTSDGNNISCERTDTAYVSEPYSMKVVFTAASQDLYIGDTSEGYVLEEGKYYILSFYTKTVSGEEAPPKLDIVSGDNKSYIGSAVPDGEWQKTVINFKAVNNRIPFIRTSAKGSVLIDDIKVSEAFDTMVMENASTLPIQCERNVKTDSAFKLVLNNAISECSVSFNEAPASIIDISENTVTFAPSETFAYDMVYKMKINITDESGRAFELTREFRTEPVFVTDGIKLYTDYGGEGQTDITNAALVGGRVTAELGTLRNNADEAAKASMILALYKDKHMIDAKYVKTELAPGTAIDSPLYVSLDMPETLSDGEYTISVFLWNGFDQITPLLKKVELNNTIRRNPADGR